MTLLELHEVSRSFGSLYAVDGVTTSIETGEIRGLIGPNGAGKTTLVNLLSGFLSPSHGRISLGGVRVDGEPAHARVRHGIGRTFQTPQAFSSLTVLDNLTLPGWLPRFGGVFADLIPLPGAGQARRAARDRARGVAAVLGIADTLDRYPSELPLGKRRLIELARALCAEPQLLLLDEPASGLDAEETARFAELLLRVRDIFKLTMLLVEHDMQLVLSVADYLYVLNFGRLLAQGDPAMVVSDPAVVAAYLGGDDADANAAPLASRGRDAQGGLR